VTEARRAANYLSVGQIYLLDNPLWREPLRLEPIKPRLLGHWGTTPGLNFVYTHLNRAIVERDLDMIIIVGPEAPWASRPGCPTGLRAAGCTSWCSTPVPAA
jgi:phosphoketolase